MASTIPRSPLLELADLINRQSFHGEALVMAMSGPDNVARAEKLLLEAEAEGLIERGKFDPTKTQRFFGVGGMAGDNLSREHSSATCFHWITKTFIWL